MEKGVQSYLWCLAVVLLELDRGNSMVIFICSVDKKDVHDVMYVF